MNVIPMGPTDLYWKIPAEKAIEYLNKGLLIHVDGFDRHLVIRQVIYKIPLQDSEVEQFNVVDLTEWLHPVLEGVVAARIIYSKTLEIEAV